MKYYILIILSLCLGAPVALLTGCNTTPEQDAARRAFEIDLIRRGITLVTNGTVSNVKSNVHELREDGKVCEAEEGKAESGKRKAEMNGARRYAWSRREWAALRDTVRDKDVRGELLYIAKRLGTNSADADERNLIVRDQRYGILIRPTARNADRSLKWIDENKLAQFAGKQVLGAEDDGVQWFRRYQSFEEKPEIECSELVIAEGEWQLEKSPDGVAWTPFLNAVYRAGTMVIACRPWPAAVHYRLRRVE